MFVDLVTFIGFNWIFILKYFAANKKRIYFQVIISTCRCFDVNKKQFIYLFIFRYNLEKEIITLSQKILNMPCLDSVRAYVLLQILTMPTNLSEKISDILEK